MVLVTGDVRPFFPAGREEGRESITPTRWEPRVLSRTARSGPPPTPKPEPPRRSRGGWLRR
ncbi:Uncharacterised protein [Amycolatopsis camponoti]|uniref:Uncharacterized protein n=1 Tax=Amycolatopsis camponoti TaxID=2606593 RepID=A0A6I8M272_9PSEU|nr:Uncharacterised protein [Amycolatopsis camponoti]